MIKAYSCRWVSGVGVGFYGLGHNLRNAAYTFRVRMDAIVEHLVTVVGVERMEVNQLQSLLFGHLLLDGDDAVHDDGVVDFPG